MKTLQNTFNSDKSSLVDQGLQTSTKTKLNFLSKFYRDNTKSLPEIKVDSFGNVVIDSTVIISPSKLEEFTNIMNNLAQYMSYEE